MKKITYLVAMLITASALFSQGQFKWNGSQALQEWDYATANWLDPGFPVPIPKTFIDGSDAIFDDSSVEGSDTIKVNGTINVDSIKINATKTYVLRRTADTDGLTGAGALIKDGEGTFVLDVKNSLLNGTVIRAGKLMMEKQTTPNIFGAKLVFEGGTANFATTSSGSYPSISVPIEIKDGVTAKIEVSRYSYFASPISGNGDLEIAIGGERTMMGTNKAGGVAVNWSNFNGNVTFKRHVMAGITPGYYGMLLPITKTWDYTDIHTVDSLFWNRTLTLKSGAGLTGASGTRCYGIGELQAEDDNTFLGGYGAGKSTSPRVYYMIGGKNTDVVCPVTIRDVGGSGYNYVGIIKTGTGKYTFTSTKSITTASLGVQVYQGTFLVDIPVTDNTTALGRCSQANVLTISANAIGGGNGRLTGKVQVDSLGTLVIGNNDIGQLVLADTLSGKVASPLVLDKNGKIEFKLRSAQSYDRISTSSTATLNNGTLLLKPATGVSISDGDRFTILSANKAVEADTFKLEVQGFDANMTFTAATDTIGGGYRIIVTAHGSTSVKQVKNNLTSVFPNPTTGVVNFSADNSAIQLVEIINLQGQTVMTRTYNAATVSMNLEGLKSGVYYARLKTADGPEIHKLILQ